MREYQATGIILRRKLRNWPKRIYTVPTLSEWRRVNLRESVDSLMQRRRAWAEKMDAEERRLLKG